MVATALTIAGSDSGGGAGIQADLKTFSALGVFGTSVLTAVTAQNTQAVTAVHPIPEDIVAAQIKAVLSDIRVDAVKIGMLGTGSLVRCVADALADYAGPLVLDPVMIAKSGDALLADEAIASLRQSLLPRADLLTPNLPEAARLLDCSEAPGLDEMERQGRALLDLGARAVMMKGGHGKGEVCVDLLIAPDRPTLQLAATRIQTGNTHGTGCTLSSAIAAELAKGAALTEAVAAAHAYLQGAIGAADQLQIGQGHGPTHHFHAIWPR